MEEDDDGGTGLKFLQEVDIDRGRGLRAAGFIEEDTNTFDERDGGCTKGVGKMEGGGGI